MFLFQLSHFKKWLLHDPTNVERTLICRTLAGMHCTGRYRCRTILWLGNKRLSWCTLRPAIMGQSMILCNQH